MLLPAIRQARLTGAFGCASDAIGRGRCLLALQNIQSEGELTTISTICAAVARGLLVQAFWESPLQGIYYYSSICRSCQKEARCVCTQTGDVGRLMHGASVVFLAVAKSLRRSWVILSL